MLRRIHVLLGSVLSRSRFERDMADELRAHLEMRVDTLMAAGLSRDAARRQARLEFGSAEAYKDGCRDVRLLTPLDGLWRDLRLAARSLRRAPAFSAATILTFALGIGATTALFSVADPLFTRPLPIDRPGDLVLFRTLGSPAWPDQEPLVPFALFDRLQSRGSVFSTTLVSEYQRARRRMRLRDVQGSELGESVWVEHVSGAYFQTLGIDAGLGRLFSEVDDRPGAPPLAVIGHGYWQRRFGGDAGVVGRAVRLVDAGAVLLPDGLDVTIAGVAPRGFTGIDLDVVPDLWVTMTPLREASGWFDGGTHVGLARVVARLRSGVTLEQAQAEVDVIAADAFGALTGTQYAGVAASRPRIRVESAARGYSRVRDRFRQPVLILAVAVGFVLLAGCANVAGLLLARGASRRRELGLRLSLGSGRIALARLLLAECALLAIAGATLALPVVQGSRLLLAGTLPSELAVMYPAGLDVRVLGFAAGASIVSLCLAGLLPILWMSSVDLNRLLGESGRTRARARVHALVLATQVTIALMLLAGGGLFLQTLANLRRVETGFDPDRVIQLTLDTRQADAVAGLGWSGALLDRLRVLPGIDSLSYYLTAGTLLQDGDPAGDFTVSALRSPADSITGSSLGVGPRFFETTGIATVAGTVFGPQDSPRSGPVVISESLARRLFGSAEAAVGESLATPAGFAAGMASRIVGVVEDVPHASLRDLDLWAVYRLAGGFAPGPAPRIVLRTDREATGLIPDISAVLDEFGHTFAITGIETFRQRTEMSIGSERLMAHLVTSFGVLTALLAAIGIAGLVSYSVAQRTKEIGVRMALGARAWNVVAMVTKEVLGVAALGVAVGIAVAIGAAQFVSNLLFDVSPADPIILGLATLGLMVVAGAAASLPAGRAARRMDPVVALRDE